MGEVRAQSSGPTPSSLCDVGLTAYSRELYGVPFLTLRVVPHFPSGMVERAKRERA